MIPPLVKLAAPTGEPLNILKARAKRLKREHDISHAKALEVIATRAYYGDSKASKAVSWEFLDKRALMVMDNDFAYQHTHGVFHDINLSAELVTCIREVAGESLDSPKFEPFSRLSVVQQIQTVLTGGKIVISTGFFIQTPFQIDAENVLRIKLSMAEKQVLATGNMTMIWGMLTKVFNSVCEIRRPHHFTYGDDGFAAGAMGYVCQFFTAFGSNVTDWENFLIREADYPNRQVLISMAENGFATCLSTFGNKPAKFKSNPVGDAVAYNKERSLLLSVIDAVKLGTNPARIDKKLAELIAYIEEDGWEIEEENPKAFAADGLEKVDPEKMAISAQWPAPSEH